MAVGTLVTKANVDALAGALPQQLDGVLLQVQQFKAWLDTQTDPNLTTLGYTAGEIATLRSAFVDMDQFRTVWQGTGTRTPVYDYRTFAKLLMGVGVH